VFLTATLPPTMQCKFERTMLLEDVKYIRALTMRREVQFNVEVCVDGAIEDEVCLTVESTEMRLNQDERMVVFCKSRKQCEILAERMECDAYHAGISQQEEKFERWKKGERRTIVATGALGTGVDVSGIRRVVFVSTPYGAMDFSQCYGRAGREGEQVNCSVILEEREWNRLQKVDGDTLKPNDRVMREFLVTSECRRKVLSEFMDGDSVECGEINGELCDRCMSTKASVNHLKELVELEEANLARRIRWMRKLNDRLEGRCAFCFCKGVTDDHAIDDCSEIIRKCGKPYVDLRRNIHYEGCDGRICFVCSMPGDWCMNYCRRVKCDRTDVVIPICIAGYIVTDFWKLICEVAGHGFKDPNEYLRWLGKSRVVWNGVKGTNALMVLETLIERII
jgi:Helicase conserved C-terminal domain